MDRLLVKMNPQSLFQSITHFIFKNFGITYHKFPSFHVIQSFQTRHETPLTTKISCRECRGTPRGYPSHSSETGTRRRWYPTTRWTSPRSGRWGSRTRRSHRGPASGTRRSSSLRQEAPPLLTMISTSTITTPLQQYVPLPTLVCLVHLISIYVDTRYS